jgi:ribosomal protein S18 acetylase RimI-like enzyme
LDKAIKLRPVTAKDESFLKRVYAQSRDREMQSTGWPLAQQKAFLESQYTLRALSYAAEHPTAEHEIILYKSRPIGALIHQTNDNQIDFIDIAILTARRGKGIGRQVVTHLCGKAQKLGISVRLFVQVDNYAAKRLYEKLGFLKTGMSATHYEMKWVYIP